ncbi:uncharacterized protein SPPG_00553 [Spizellomyces punctatus DAOM BR117]|uniref:GST N-terminal domain-containing protein n=1 Tax=Spizellomyces punctatus (strain DAOM BR117) TaxID=645134 RepID=A0A0L0HUP4_SPIPD|nr:uncharacterized protein SPPG_00553 [Spizellomyces punctatus DAOM BR117]KND04853.1 hypothetical protein SPPG_00553 [Spizellomyces punctatus DAOM BR117]|eukprot:XP_016612892.1 hypothetical protein SPPG_00553 [Spizellomyces punctatus DAOM BR117]
MKLYYSPASPYARKVLIVAHELGIRDQLEVVTVSVNPKGGPDTPVVSASNPLGKIPTLVLKDGTALYDSRVICEYLDSIAGGNLFPREHAPPRWVALRRLALGDGIVDAALSAVYESRETIRPVEKQYQGWIDAQWAKVVRALDALEEEADTLANGQDATIGELAVATALGYLDFRFAAKNWASSRPKLAKWYNEQFLHRASFVSSQPPSS